MILSSFRFVMMLWGGDPGSAVGYQGGESAPSGISVKMRTGEIYSSSVLAQSSRRP